MTKRGKLIGTIVCLLFIAIMIPIAIFASTTNSATTKNYVKFNVVDFQGNFFLALEGNKENNIGTITTTTITPAQLFTAKYKIDPITQEGSYHVYNVYNSDTETLVQNDVLNFPEVNIEFDAEHTDISYYFVFINTATNITADDNRDVYISTHSNSIDNTTAEWTYCLKSNPDPNLTTFDLPQTWTSNDPIITNGFQEIITVPARTDNTQEYNYIIMKYTISISPELREDINSQFTITINFDTATSIAN